MRITRLLLSAAVAVAMIAVPLAVPAAALLPVSATCLALLVGVLAWLWPRASGVQPALASSAVLAVAGGAALATAEVLPGQGALEWWPAFLAVGVLLGFVLQLLRGHDATGKVEAMAGFVSGLLAVVSSAGWAVWIRSTAAAPSLGAWVTAAASVVVAVSIAAALLGALRSGWGAALTPGAGHAPSASEPRLPLRGSVVVAAGLAAVLLAGVPVALLTRIWG